MTQQTNQHMDQQINPSQQDNKKQISFELIQAQETGMLFSPDFLVIYGLSGKSEISISSRQYKIETGGLLTAAPFTYLDYDCGADSGFSVLHITQEVLRIADVSSIARIWCYVRNADPGIEESYDRIRRKYAQLFALYFQNGTQREIRMFACATELLRDFAIYFSSSEPVTMQLAGSETYERCVRMITLCPPGSCLIKTAYQRFCSMRSRWKNQYCLQEAPQRPACSF